jgi:hypothetical protein
MVILKKLTVLLITIVFCLSMAVSSSSAQRGRYWHGDNGRHYGWYKRNKRWRRGYVSYRRYPRYYSSYYPRRRYVRYYRTYPRYYGYNPYPVYYYPYRRRSGLSVNFNFR